MIKRISKFKIKSNNSTDYLSLILIFAGVMSALSSLESTLSGRKYKRNRTSCALHHTCREEKKKKTARR
jgi:hypothetical protein